MVAELGKLMELAAEAEAAAVIDAALQNEAVKMLLHCKM